MKKRVTISLILLSLLVVSAAACNPFGGGKEEDTASQPVSVARGDLAITVTGSGTIETSREARFAFGSGGKVAKINVKEGDTVTKGEVLAKLDTSALELARTQAQVTLTQAQVALTQAEVAQQTAEYNLKNTRDTKDTLELALFNAQIDSKTAEYNLEQTQDLNTWSDIKIAQASVDQAERDLEYALEQLYKYLPPDEDGIYPKIEDAFPKNAGYKVWQDRLVYFQAQLNTAEDRLEALISNRDMEETAIKRLRVEAAEMAEVQAQKNLDKLSEDIAIKDANVESAKQSVEQNKQSVALAQLSLDDAQRQLDEATVTATFDGVVARVEAKEGETIPPPTISSQTIVHVIDPTSLELVVEMDEIDIPEVKLNQEAIITVDALPDVTIKGQVTSIYPLPIEEGGVVLYNVKIGLEVTEGLALKVGMSADADITVKKRSNVLLVPSRAIKDDSQGNPTVRVMVNDQIQERPVVVGLSDDSQTEIVSGLAEGESIIVEIRKPKPESEPGLFF
ncbi:efflux RND transporter periplasmic adaptor subunit [Chloroflexota bacterium]